MTICNTHEIGDRSGTKRGSKKKDWMSMEDQMKEKKWNTAHKCTKNLVYSNISNKRIDQKGRT